MEPASLILICSGLFVGWTIGANDAANCMGPAVGSGLLNYRKAIIFISIWAILGALYDGHRTISTVGEDLVMTAAFSSEHLAIGLIAAALVITVLTLLAIPISSTQAVLGSIVGMAFTTEQAVQWNNLGVIFLLGFVTPFAALICAYLFHKYAVPLFIKRDTFLRQEKFIRIIVILSGMLIAYSLGANNIGNAMGLSVAKGSLTAFNAAVLGGVAIALGTAMLGPRVMRTVGQGITDMDVTMALSAQMGAGIVVYVLTLFGIPTSFTFAIVGAVMGVGLIHGLGSIRVKTVTTVFASWFAAPLVSAVLTIAGIEVFRIMFL